MSAELRFIGTNSQGRRADARRAIRQDVAGRDGGTHIAFRHMPADTEASSTRCAGMTLEKIVNLHVGHRRKAFASRARRIFSEAISVKVAPGARSNSPSPAEDVAEARRARGGCRKTPSPQGGEGLG